MKTVRLHMDHRQNVGGKVIVHKAGSVVELPDREADFIAGAVRETRIARRAEAEKIPGTPENKSKGEPS